MLDIGTAELLFWKPRYRESETEARNIIGLKEDNNSSFFITGIGLERLCMATNSLERVQDIDYIKPFYNLMEQQIGKRNFLAGESLRALHRIYSDILKFSIPTLSRQRRYKINRLIRNILEAQITSSEIERLLKIHTETQPWHPELAKGIDFTLYKIEVYRKGDERR
ncbi:hypothetical protein HYW75_02640 [Candidatus Pacearchaeota archaeon]|nr:hypothetical protein [Candidatus Pacearchaeota archaeon]